MSEKLEIRCLNTGSMLEVEGGESLLEISRRVEPELGFEPICARVNNNTENLAFRVYAPKTVEFLDVRSASGERTYIRSLCMVLYKALHDCYPAAKLSIEHSISSGYYCLLEGVETTVEVTKRLEKRMREIVEADIAFVRRELPTQEVAEIFRRQGLEDKVLLMETRHEPYTVFYTLGDVADSYYGAMALSTGILRVFALRLYKKGMLLLGFDKSNPGEPPLPVTQEKMYKAFTDYLAFNRIVGVSNVGELNRKVMSGDAKMLINVSEALHDKRIGTIADAIAERYERGGARVVFIAGPSSSGKTTFTKRLAIHLITNLFEPRLISLDDYFVDREHTPRDEKGDYDYESLHALDLELFNADLSRLLRGESVRLPRYNFTTGLREYRNESVSLSSRSILLIEGIHGLNPELSAEIAAEQKFGIYVSALTTISIDDHNWVSTTDNRLVRRIIRDARYRGADAVSTIRRWPSVRRGEERWIFPYQENADAMFNSSLLFELGVMRNRADELLRRVPHDVEEYAEAKRLRAFLYHFEEIGVENVPSTSILREFLGGSSFRY